MFTNKNDKKNFRQFFRIYQFRQFDGNDIVQKQGLQYILSDHKRRSESKKKKNIKL